MIRAVAATAVGQPTDRGLADGLVDGITQAAGVDLRVVGFGEPADHHEVPTHRPRPWDPTVLGSTPPVIHTGQGERATASLT